MSPFNLVKKIELACSSFKGSPSTGFKGTPHMNGSTDDLVVVVAFLIVILVYNWVSSISSDGQTSCDSKRIRKFSAWAQHVGSG
jgi:hypothetical protein